MDNVVEREDQEASALRREAVRAAQKSTTNIFLFRRLKWGRPGVAGGGAAAGRRGISLIDILLWLAALITVGMLAYVAIL